jgi:ABC-type polysaccharide/polyol phosphate export permease
MAKDTKESAKIVKKKSKREDILPLESINYKILLAGVAVIVVGYIALSTGVWDGPMALTVAPILLVIGYCVLIPFGIMYRPKKAVPAEPAADPTKV